MYKFCDGVCLIERFFFLKERGGELLIQNVYHLSIAIIFLNKVDMFHYNLHNNLQFMKRLVMYN